MTTPSGSEAVLVDSSGWLEYITADAKADAYAPYIESESILLVPTIVLCEVRKILLLRKSRTEADIFVSHALRKQIVDLDEKIALAAATASILHHLAMADAIVYATSQTHQAQLITSDTHFAGLPNVVIL